MPLAALANQRALRACRQLKGEAWPTPTYSHMRGERNAGMRDSLAGVATASRAILLVVCREARGPFVPGGRHAKRYLQGDHHLLLQQYAPVCIRILCKTVAN